MTRNGRVFALKYTSKVIPTLVVVPTLPPAGVSVVLSNIPVERPSSIMSKANSSTKTEATTSKGKEVVKEQ